MPGRRRANRFLPRRRAGTSVAPLYPRKRPLPDRPYAGGDRPKPAYHGRGGVAGLHAVACYAVPERRGVARISDYLLAVIAQIARMPYEDTEARRRVEFLNVISEEVIKLRNSLDNCEIELSISIYASLLRRHLQTLRIPYEGEPLEGIQVMGILETRNLDFRNVILLSMNDDNFPGSVVTGTSFIPYNLRAAYALPTPEHHEGVYAYYFYRLLQRAENVRMLYCAHADDKTTGEQSRYIYQLEYETPFEILRREVGIDVNRMETPPIEVPKQGETAEKLARFLAPDDPVRLSPTAFSGMWLVPCASIFTPWPGWSRTTRFRRRSMHRCSVRFSMRLCSGSMLPLSGRPAAERRCVR